MRRRPSDAPVPSLLAIASLLASWTLLLTGCSQQAAEEVPPAEVSQSKGGQTATEPAAAERESWDALYIGGAKVGYVHTTVRKLQEGGRELLEISAEQRLSVNRFGDRSEPGIAIKSVETPAGELLRFESRQELGPQPVITVGRVANSKLHLETTSTGKTVTSEMPWPQDAGGFFVQERSLERQPMQPGEQRTLRGLAPMFDQVLTFELAAQEKEAVELLDGTRQLLRIDVAIHMPDGSKLHSTVWTDERGDMLKTHVEELKQETFRTTKEVALSRASQGPLDLGVTTVVKLAQPIDNAHQTRRVRYQVRLEPAAGEGQTSDPARVFASGPRQEIQPIDDNTAELIVRAVRPGDDIMAPAAAGKPPTEADRVANNLIQSDDPRILEMAEEAAGDEQDPVKIALALESYVRKNIREVNFSQALATAADVAQSREGDCTEHAVLLAALARAKGIPARVAIGLVYVNGLQGFGYHMWNELYVGDRWIAFDGTLGQGGVGAAHLKLSDSDLAGGDAFASFLPVARVLGRLKIEVLEVE